MPNNKQISPRKTLLQDAPTLTHIYKQEKTGKKEPKKNKVETNKDNIYHKTLNAAHYILLEKAKEIAISKTAKSKISTANFAVAEVVFIIQTTKKRVPISFPIFTDEDIYNCNNIDKAEFKDFCQSAQDNSEKILADKNLKLTSQGGYMDYINAKPGYYPQKAYHSEKFFFYYLINGGLKKIVDLFRTKSITPETLAFVKAIEIRIHSSLDMCPTCESIAISEKNSIIALLNQLLINKNYPALPENFTCDFLMSYHKPEQAGKPEENLVGIQSQLIAKPKPPVLIIKDEGKIIKKNKILFSAFALNAHRYTYFTSGGSCEAFQNVIVTAASEAKQIAKQLTNKIENSAAIEIQRIFKGFLTRKKLKKNKI